MREKSNHTYNL